MRSKTAAGVGFAGILAVALLFGILSEHFGIYGPAAAMKAAEASNSVSAASSRLARSTPSPQPTVLVMLLPTARPAISQPSDANQPSTQNVAIALAVPAAAEDAGIEAAAPDARNAASAREGEAAVLNGVPIEQIVILPAEVGEHVREIAARGRELGRDANAFSKVGDSTMVFPPFLADFGSPDTYRLGPHEYLQPTIDYYQNSYARKSIATKKGMHSWSEFDPSWADPQRCGPGEGPLACELRVHNPSVAIIRLGANDAGSTELFNGQMREIVERCLELGIVPVLGTKPDRIEGPGNELNNTVKRIAAEYQIPLWDYDRIAATVEGKGLEADRVHYRLGSTHDFTTPEAYTSGDPLEDLTALMMLDTIHKEILQPIK